MDFVLQYPNWLLIAAVLVSGFLLFSPKGRKVSGATLGVTPVQAVQLINHQRAVVVDVRPADQFEAGHIVNARNLPFDALSAETAASSLPKNKTLPLIVTCGTGMLSQKALAILKNAGYENVQSLQGGLKEWIKSEMPLEKSAASGTERDASKSASKPVPNKGGAKKNARKNARTENAKPDADPQAGSAVAVPALDALNDSASVKDTAETGQIADETMVGEQAVEEQAEKSQDEMVQTPTTVADTEAPADAEESSEEEASPLNSSTDQDTSKQTGAKAQ